MYHQTYIAMCLFCMLQLGFLAFMEARRRNAFVSCEKYFLIMLYIAIVAFAADIASSFTASTDWEHMIVAGGDYTEIFLDSLLIPMFLKYVCGQISGLDIKLKRRVETIIWSMFGLCLLAELSTFFSGAIFYFDASHIYHRGPYFMAPMIIMLGMMLIIEVFIVSQRQKIESAYYKTLLMFLAAPFIGWALQSMIFGLPFSLIGVTFAAQVVFTNIQNRNIDKDYLTGAFNRQTLDSFIRHKIERCKKDGQLFSALLLDIDNFKAINDQYGHFEGDMALIKAVSILRETVGRRDFIGRYGGDEFCVVLDSAAQEDVSARVDEIRGRFTQLSSARSTPYDIVFSIGSAIYTPETGGIDDFYKQMDKNMYIDKKDKYRRSVRWQTARRSD
jgi:diguanylate cyclase (GGDEF)-like protein